LITLPLIIQPFIISPYLENQANPSQISSESIIIWCSIIAW